MWSINCKLWLYGPTRRHQNSRLSSPMAVRRLALRVRRTECPSLRSFAQGINSGMQMHRNLPMQKKARACPRHRIYLCTSSCKVPSNLHRSKHRQARFTHCLSGSRSKAARYKAPSSRLADPCDSNLRRLSKRPCARQSCDRPVTLLLLLHPRSLYLDEVQAPWFTLPLLLSCLEATSTVLLRTRRTTTQLIASLRCQADLEAERRSVSPLVLPLLESHLNKHMSLPSSQTSGQASSLARVRSTLLHLFKCSLLFPRHPRRRSNKLPHPKAAGSATCSAGRLRSTMFCCLRRMSPPHACTASECWRASVLPVFLRTWMVQAF